MLNATSGVTSQSAGESTDPNRPGLSRRTMALGDNGEHPLPRRAMVPSDDCGRPGTPIQSRARRQRRAGTDCQSILNRRLSRGAIPPVLRHAASPRLWGHAPSRGSFHAIALARSIALDSVRAYADFACGCVRRTSRSAAERVAVARVCFWPGAAEAAMWSGGSFERSSDRSIRWASATVIVLIAQIARLERCRWGRDGRVGRRAGAGAYVRVGIAARGRSQSRIQADHRDGVAARHYVRQRSMFDRRTKIVATLGPATDPRGVLDALVAAGIDCARLNCSHGTAEDLRRRSGEVRAAAAHAGRPVGLLFDLQGPKLRLAAGMKARIVRAGEQVVFSGRATPRRTIAWWSTFRTSRGSSPSARRS